MNLKPRATARLVFLALTSVGVLAFVISASLQVAAGAAELAVNGGWESGALAPWTSSPSTATAAVTTTVVQAGTYAGSLDKTSGDTGTVDVMQTVNVNGGQAYTLSGYAFGNPGVFNNVRIQIKWLDSNGHTLQTNTASSDVAVAAWTLQTIGPIVAPITATQAVIGGHGNIMTGQGHTTPSPVYFDSFSFSTEGPTAVTLSSFSARPESDLNSAQTTQIMLGLGAAGTVGVSAFVVRRLVRRRRGVAETA